MSPKFAASDPVLSRPVANIVTDTDRYNFSSPRSRHRCIVRIADGSMRTMDSTPHIWS